MQENLKDIFDNQSDRMIRKWNHYFTIYERYFSKYRDKEIVILEIGISHGGSLQVWRKYFGPKAKIYGIDINPNCLEIKEENTKIFIGSQDDREFLKQIKTEIPKIDILIDDGGHLMNQQIVAFEELYSHIKNDGIYLCEDNHTSYWKSHKGGDKKKGTYIEYTKKLIDKLHAWHSESADLKVDDFTTSSFCISYYDSIVVIEKGIITAPTQCEAGLVKVANVHRRLSFMQKAVAKIKYEYSKISK